MAGVTAIVKNAIEGTTWVYLTGTIAEVMQELADENITASKLKFYSDDASNAKALYCKTA